MAQLVVKSSTAADGTFSATGATVWNAGMSPSSGQLSAAFGGTGVDGSAAANGAIPIGNGTGFTLATLTQGTGVTITNGAGTITIAASGGSSTWDTIGAAAADGTTNNGVNRIVYNTAPTANNRIAWRFTESSAATNGTSTSGVPNQVLLQLDTLASSTQSPLKVLTRGTHVFSVSPTATQILGANGTASAPLYSFAANTGLGLYHDSGNGVPALGRGGTVLLTFAIAVGNYASVQGGITDMTANTNLMWPVSGSIAITNNTDGEWVRWSSFLQQVSRGSADATSYALNFRKSRGTVGSPTVITTGDVLETKSAYAYVGATNTYLETSRYEVKSGGTISDATTGVGSVVTIYGKTQGTDVTPQPAVVITGGSTATFKFAGTGMVAANGTVATVLGSVGPTGANTTVQEWLKVDTPNGTRYIPCF